MHQSIKETIILTAKLQVKFFKDNLCQNVTSVKLKRLLFLNNQIKFYTQTSKWQLYYSTFHKSIKSIYDLCYITLRQWSQHYHYHFRHRNNQPINTFLYTTCWFFLHMHLRLVQLVLHLHMHSSITHSGAGRFFVMIDSYD